jgi:prevent-host-death family protein
MATKFSEDIVPLSDLKVNPGKIVNRTKDTHRPILLTSRGRGVAVVQGLEEYENLEEERALMKAVTQSLIDIKEGKEQNFEDVKIKLGIKI